MNHGPNTKKLIIRKMSSDAIPSGGGFADGLRFLSEPTSMRKAMIAAEKWVQAAIKSVRSAGEPNEWKNASDEEIAAEVLRRLEKGQS